MKPDDRLNQFRKDLTEVSQRVDALLHRRVSYWVRRNPKSAGLFLGVLAIASTYIVGWWLPTHAKLSEAYEINRIDGRIAARLNDPLAKLDKISNDLAEIKGKLEILGPLIQNLIHTKVKETAGLSPKKLTAALPEIKSTIQAAREGKIEIEPTALVELGGRILKEFPRESAMSADAWQVVAELIAYRSVLNSLRGVDKSVGIVKVFPDRPRGRQEDEWFLLENALVILDGKPGQRGALWTVPPPPEPLRRYIKFIFRNCVIEYGDGPIILDKVIFINCTFKVSRSAQGEQLARALLNLPISSIDLAEKSAP